MCVKKAVRADGTIDESVSASVIDHLFANKGRIEAMVQEAKEYAKTLDFKKYIAQAKEFVSRYKHGDV